MFLKKGYVLDNRYEIIEKIGAGGMSIVYKAHCTHLNRIVAIKVLREEFIEDENFVNKFTEEAKLVASLSHQNIVNIYDVGRDGDFCYIVMEYLDGKDLENIVHKLGNIDQTSALTILYNVGEALKYAHDNGIIHRDLKSKNIIITDDGIVKVADFGIATATTTSTISVATNAIGSVHYFSPEQAKGEGVDGRSDIYSLGIIGYELVTGDLPFDGDTPVQVALKHVTDDMPRPSLKADVSSSFDFLIMKATSKDKLDRYQSVSEFLEDIDKILDGKNITTNRMVGDEIKKDEVINFGKILEDEKEDDFTNNEVNEKELKNKAQIARDNLNKLENVHNEYDKEDGYYINETINEINDYEKSKKEKTVVSLTEGKEEKVNTKEQERKEKFNKLLVKLGIVSEEADEVLYAPQKTNSNEEDEKDDSNEEKEELKFDEHFNLVKDNKNSKINDELEKQISKKYISLDGPIKDSSVTYAREQEKITKAKIAATRFFDDNEDDEEVVIVESPKKKKFNLFNFITVEVEDDLTDEEYKKLKREEKRKKREEKYIDSRKDEEMVDGYISKDDDRKIVRAAVATSLVIIAFMLFGIIKFIVYLNDNKLIEVKNYVGENYNDIKSKVEDYGFTLDVVDEESSDKYPEGVILNQNFEEGKMLPKHTKIEVVLSKGKVEAVMPDLESRTVSEALAALEKYNVHITTQTIPSESIGKDCIVQTSPSYGMALEKGANVVLYISDGSGTKYMVPNLIGLTEKEAKEALEKVGLSLYKAEYATNDKENAVVVLQSDPEGTALFMNAGVSIQLNISSNRRNTNTNKDKDDKEDSSSETTGKIDKANVRIESKQGMLLPDEEYVVEILAEQPSQKEITVLYRNKLKGKDINDTFTKVFELELGSKISLYIDDVLQKELNFN